MAPLPLAATRCDELQPRETHVAGRNVARDTPLPKPTESRPALVLTRGVRIELLVKRPEALSFVTRTGLPIRG